LIVAVNEEASVDAAALRSTLSEYVEDKTGKAGTQIEVQKFNMGSDTAGQRRYVIYTELESLLSPEKRNTIKDMLEKSPVIPGVSVSAVEEGVPKFFLTWKEGKEICKRYCANGMQGYDVVENDTCESIALSQGMTTESLQAANAGVSCAAPLVAGSAVCVGKANPKTPGISCVAGREYDIAQAFSSLKIEGTSLEFKDIEIESDWERRVDLEYYETQALVAQDSGGDKGGSAKHWKRHTQDKMKRKAGEKGRSFTVRIDEFKSDVAKVLQEKYPDADVLVESSTSVSESVGKDMLANGLVAILYALIGILGYIGLRFDFRYSPGAVFALAHDSLITIGIFSILQVKFTQPIIAAILTIIGYSLNDTIVVFDRIRENVTRYRGKELVSVINTSINETLSRTVLTSITTLLVVGSILIFGGGLIKDFAFALLIGILVGTYSSIFIASPVVIYMDNFFKRRAAASKEATPAMSNS